MARLVRMRQGCWNKISSDDWEFNCEPSDLGFGAMVRDDESFETLLEIVRSKYLFGETTPVVLTYQYPEWMLGVDGKKIPPVNVATTIDVTEMMNVRVWYPELTLCVTMGSASVAKYQFQCRSSFTVGGDSYTVDGAQDPAAKAAFQNLVSGMTMDASQAVLDEIFNEEEMLVIHIVHLEMTQARDVPDAPTNPPHRAGKEIIEVEDDEPTMMQGIEGGDCSLFPITTDGSANLVNDNRDLVFGTVDIAQLGLGHTTLTHPSCGGIDDAMLFWEGLLSDEFKADEFAVPTTIDTNPNTAIYTETLMVGNLPPHTADVTDPLVPDNCSTTDSSDELGSPLRPIGSQEPNILQTSTITEEQRAGQTNIRAIGVGPQASNVLEASNTAEGQITSQTDTRVVGAADANIAHLLGTDNMLSLDLTLGCGNMGSTADRSPQPRSDVTSADESDILEHENNPSVIFVGMVFKNREAFKHHMALYALSNRFHYRSPRSTPDLMVLQCCGLYCKWRVYAVRAVSSDIFEIRKVHSSHTCTIDERAAYDRQASSNVIGEMMRPRFAGPNSGPRSNSIIGMMQGDHNVRISYWKAWRSREIAMDSARGTSSSSYKHLPVYLTNLVSTNPGTLVKLHTVSDDPTGHRFKFLFCALGASIKGFPYMRKVIVVDGAHLKGKYAGSLLTASAQDGNYQIFPLAFAIVDGENDKSWEWFFRQLSEFVLDGEELVFVSDRHASIYYGIKKVYPKAGHCACIVHLTRNIKTYFKKRHLGYLVMKAARAYKITDFYIIFQEIKRMDEACADYLLGIGLEHWARLHFHGSRYNIMTSNVAESWNAVLREAREYPIVPLVEYIRSKLMNWFSKRRDAANKSVDTLTPRVTEILATNFEMAGGYDVHKVNESEYEVRNKDGISFLVDLSDKSCSCFEFQTLRIPCSHAIAAAIRSKVRVDGLVAQEYTINLLRLAYTGDIYPVTGEKDEPDITTAFSGLSLNPPTTRRPPEDEEVEETDSVQPMQGVGT